MGASRKLQGEIDRVLKKVQEGVDVFDSIWNKVYDTENANQKEKFEADLKKEIKKLQRYRDQIKTWIQSSEIKDKKALMDARKLIEREMERFKVCEKETKTKAFSKEGLGQQPKTDPKEKAKSETRDWLNILVGELESQIDVFEAEVEGLSVKKGKTRPPRLTHLEASITRHKAHIMKLELILRLLDNDELSPEQVNDVKEFIDDYVERNQDDFDEFADVDELYSSLPLEKVEALEDLVSLGPASLAKGVASVSTATALLGLKNSVTSPPAQITTAFSSSEPQNISQDTVEDAASQESNPDVPPKTPSKSGVIGSLAPAVPPGISSAVSVGPTSTVTASVPVRPPVTGPTVAAILSGPPSVRGASENSSSAVSSSLLNSSSSAKEEDNLAFPGRRTSPSIPEISIGKGISRGISNQASISSSMSFSSAGGISGNVALGSVPALSDLPKRSTLNVDERIGSSGLTQPLVSPLSNRMLLQPMTKTEGTGSNDSGNIGESPIGGRVFTSSVVPGVQWRPQNAAFQNTNETGQFRGRPEIAPDQREKFLQRLQQVQQQGHSNLLSVPHLSSANHKQFTTQQQNSLLPQFSPQSTSVSPHVGLGLGVQGAGLGSVSSSSQQQSNPSLQQPSPHPMVSTATKDGEAGHVNAEEQQQHMPEDLIVDPTSSPSLNKMMGEDDLKTSYAGTGPVSVAEGSQLSRDNEMSPGQPLQPGQSSASLGVIGRRSGLDLGAIGDNISGSTGNSSGMHDQIYNMQMLEAAYYKLPQPRDSERPKNYVPRHPAATPSSYPQTQAPIIDNPAFWERLGLDPMGTDALFFAFYYQPNTFQQYLAARELKRQSWRFHKKFSTWFQRHEEPKVTNDNFERGNYVYFDFHIANDGSQHGWCQRIKTDFTFEYNFLEDDLVV